MNHHLHQVHAAQRRHAEEHIERAVYYAFLDTLFLEFQLEFQRKYPRSLPSETMSGFCSRERGRIARGQIPSSGHFLPRTSTWQTWLRTWRKTRQGEASLRGYQSTGRPDERTAAGPYAFLQDKPAIRICVGGIIGNTSQPYFSVSQGLQP